MAKKNIIQALLKDAENKWKSIFGNKYKALGINWTSLKQYRNANPNQINEASIYDSPFFFRDGHELFHAIDEILLEEAYAIRFPTATPFIIDCGSHIGTSLLYFKTHYPQSRIIAFEPDPENFNVLSKNKVARAWSNTTLFQEAIWIHNEELVFAGEGSMSSKIDESAGAIGIKMKARRLKDLLQEPVDLLKLDIEGAEYTVLIDIEQELYQVQHLFIEYHGSFKQQNELIHLQQILHEAGFHYYIKEANPSFAQPFQRKHRNGPYDIQLNLFCFRS